MTMTTTTDRPNFGPDSPYQLMPPLTPEERKLLKDDILAKGVIVPIAFDEDGNILDGHHRCQMYYELIDEGHKIPPYNRQIIRGLNETAKIDYVAKLNLARRHLSGAERAKVFASLREMGLTLQKIADAAGVSVGTVHGVLAAGGGANGGPAFVVGADGREMPTKYQNWSMISGARLEREVKAAARAEARKIVPDSIPAAISDRFKLITSDLRDPSLANQIPDNSIDAIITDPPYPREYLPLYSDLGRLAARVLKPGGQMVAMVGHMFLPEVIARMCEPETVSMGLVYRWTIATMMTGDHASIIVRRAHVGWKPALVFSKVAPGKSLEDPLAQDAAWLYDVVTFGPSPNSVGAGTAGGADGKEYHKWGQGLDGFTRLVELLSTPGQTVLDPFNGGGTTGAAALHLNRLYIGIDNDPDAIATTLNRFAHDEDWSHLAAPTDA